MSRWYLPPSDIKVLVRDSDDNRYEIPSLYELDKKSRAKLKSEI